MIINGLLNLSSKQKLTRLLIFVDADFFLKNDFFS